MICANISELLGIDCMPVNEECTIARLDSPFAFDDGDGVPIYVEAVNGQIRFFDDGGTMMHFLGRGIILDDGRKTRFIKSAVEPNGVSFTEDGDIEVWASAEQAPAAFASYVAALLNIVSWERDQRGASTDTALLVDEVAMYLRAWKPTAELVVGPEYIGVSRQVHRLDFKFDGQGVLATSAHAQAVSASLKKLLDIRGGGEGDAGLLVVIDDRFDKERAKREGLIIQTVASVLPFTRLAQNARGPSPEFPN